MVCTANDLSTWTDFPKGLRVLVLDEDNNSASDIKSKLEAMDYTVTTFGNETEALSALSEKPQSFHVAIVEVSTSKGDGHFKFLETAKDLPTIMTSNVHCLTTMMKCIALGAVEFLHKPLSKEKLRNIWQHVVHKAFNAGGSLQSEAFKSVKDSLQVKWETEESKNENLEKMENDPLTDEDGLAASDKYPAPSTPQLKQGGPLTDDGDFQDHTNYSMEKESLEQECESKSVEITGDEVTRPATDAGIKDEENTTEVAKNSPRTQTLNCNNNTNNGTGDPSMGSSLQNSSGTRVSRKKMKVDWTAELHKKFVQAVDQLGIDQAIPSKILELMKVEGLTRHNVASHLQKYRMQRRNILPKEEDRRWPQQRNQVQKTTYYTPKHIMAYPPYHVNNHPFPPGPVYPMWGVATGAHLPKVHTWGLPGYPSWTLAESQHWNPYPVLQADVWGCPVVPAPYSPYSPLPQNAAGFHNITLPQKHSFDSFPAEEVIDKVVKEAINKPWLPLPLGLKPPSPDSVLSELSRQGISTIPPKTI